MSRLNRQRDFPEVCAIVIGAKRGRQSVHTSDGPRQRFACLSGRVVGEIAAPLYVVDDPQGSLKRMLLASRNVIEISPYELVQFLSLHRSASSKRIGRAAI